MKVLHTLFAVFLSAFVMNASAQAPQGINYQAVARDAGGSMLINQSICIQSTITNGNGGPVLYQETFNTTTNQFGLFTLNIGNGTPVTGTLTGINWAAVTAWQQIEMKVGCSGNYVLMGSSQLLSVPYALYAAATPAKAPVNFRRAKKANQYLITPITVSWDSTVYQHNCSFSGDTGFVAPDTGIYHIDFSANFYGAGSSGYSTFVTIYLYVNNKMMDFRTVPVIFNSLNMRYGTGGISDNLQLNAGDIVSIKAEGSASPPFLYGNEQSLFSGYKID